MGGEWRRKTRLMGGEKYYFNGDQYRNFFSAVISYCLARCSLRASSSASAPAFSLSSASR